MALFQDTGGDPRTTAAQLADVLVFYGAVGDAAFGNPPGFALRKASIAVSLAQTAQLEKIECDAIFFAGLLHAVGAINNPAFRKGERLPERLARMESWDIPAQGARVCQKIAALPPTTADMVRWQAECWDGTGFPDQLRWHGIPLAAQVLALADTFLRSAEPEEALATVGLQSGRAFGPEQARTFTMWFHLSGGEYELLTPPLDGLDPKPQSTSELIDHIADHVDAHNGIPGRWRRVALLSDATAHALQLDERQCRTLAIAARLYGVGEISSSHIEDSQFDPLSRLGIDDRARDAEAAAVLVAGHSAIADAAEVIRARSEWYDGTGKPSGIRHEAIPTAAGILAAAIAYDALERRAHIRDDRGSPAERIDTASGTQFDPRIARALLSAARTHA